MFPKIKPGTWSRQSIWMQDNLSNILANFWGDDTRVPTAWAPTWPEKKIKQSKPIKPTLNGLTVNLKLVFYLQHTFFLSPSFLYVPQNQPADFFWDKIAGRKVGTVKLKPSVPSCKLQQIFMVEWKKTSWKTRLLMEVLTNPALAAHAAGLLPGP